jgi:hypothetical protein
MTGRIELPESGFAWSVPDGMTAYTIDDGYGSSPPTELDYAWQRLTLALATTQLEGLGTVLAFESDSWCAASATDLFAGSDPLEDIEAHLSLAQSVSNLTGPTEIDFHGGDAQVLSWKVANPLGLTLEHTAYAITEGSRAGIVWCASKDPDVEWLEAARAFEFVPMPVTYGTPTYRLRIVWPVGWAAWVAATGEDDWYLVAAFSGEESCAVVDEGSVPWAGATIDTVHESVLVEGKERLKRVATAIVGPEAGVGAAARFDSDVESVYLFASNDALISLSCDTTAVVPPEDRWLSIARTFEFLPEE